MVFWKLGHTVRERKIVVVVEYFEIIRLFGGSCGFLSGLSSFLYKMP